MIEENCQNHLLLPPGKRGRWPRRRVGDDCSRAPTPDGAAASWPWRRASARIPENLEGLLPEKPRVMGLDAAVGDLPRALFEPAFQGCPALRGVERSGLALERPEELRQGPGLIEDLAHRPHAVAKHQGIGVLARR